DRVVRANLHIATGVDRVSGTDLRRSMSVLRPRRILDLLRSILRKNRGALLRSLLRSRMHTERSCWLACSRRDMLLCCISTDRLYITALGSLRTNLYFGFRHAHERLIR